MLLLTRLLLAALLLLATLTRLLLTALLLLAALLLTRLLVRILIHSFSSQTLLRHFDRSFSMAGVNPRPIHFVPGFTLKQCVRNLSPRVEFPLQQGEPTMGRYLLLWLLGVPIPILVLIWLFGGLH